MEENTAAVNVELTEDDLREIEDARLDAEGARYDETAQATIDR
jgi:hypothetical protein